MSEDVQHIVAFCEAVEVLNAQWSLDSGRTVELRICGEAFDRMHPFKKYQQRRGGRMGTRFHASFAMMGTGAEMGSFEVMLMSWKDSSLNGQSVTFWLDNEPDIHPFAGCTRRKGNQVGDQFMLALVELHEDDTPVDQTKAAALSNGAHPRNDRTVSGPAQGVSGSAGTPNRSQTGRDGQAAGVAHAGTDASRARPQRKLSQVADNLVRRNARFLLWLKETKPNLVKQWTAEVAKSYVKSLIQVESLGDLDRDAEAAKRYHSLIMRPFEKWAYQRP